KNPGLDQPCATPVKGFRGDNRILTRMAPIGPRFPPYAKDCAEKRSRLNFESGSEQTVETLKKLALEGRSAAWIAAALGAPSRSAVIGKANRIGVKLNGGLRSGPIGERSRLEPPPPGIPWGR